MSRFIPNENSFVGFTLGPVGLMAPPVVTATGVAGTIPPGSPSYIVTAFNETGETAGSTPATVTLASAGGVALTWVAVPGADGYRIYGRTAAAQKYLAQVGAVLTYTDNGSVTPQTSTPPTVGGASNMAGPLVADVNNCVELTQYVSGLNFAAQGNVVPTPNLKHLFESSINGTGQATASLDLYRDDTLDTAWQLLPRKTQGFVIISRYGGIPNVTGRKCEVWPIRVSSRANANMTNNTAAMFTVTCAILETPAEDAVTV